LAPARRSGPRPWRALAALAVLIVVMLIGITGKDTFNPGKWHSHFKVGLGLDLSSGTQVTLKADTARGAPPTAGDMAQAISIIESRVNGTGNTGAQVQQVGSDLINVSVPGKAPEQVIQLVSTTAQLRFRQVLLEQAYTGPATPAPKASASPGGSPSPSASTSPKPGAAAKATSPAKATPPASPSAAATPSSAAASTAIGDPSAVQPSVMKLFDQMVCKPGTNGSVEPCEYADCSKFW